MNSIKTRIIYAYEMYSDSGNPYAACALLATPGIVVGDTGRMVLGVLTEFKSPNKLSEALSMHFVARGLGTTALQVLGADSTKSGSMPRSSSESHFDEALKGR